ncbi:MAG: formylmethanofuran dehydrogenase subunit B [Candidatus Bathyarchaeia archaeon]
MTVVTGVSCPVCGCLCDDIEVDVTDNRVISVKNACAIGEAKFLNYAQHRATTPLIKNGNSLIEASLEVAIQRSAEILVNSKYPIIYGWSNASCEAVKKGIALAEDVGGVIDNTSTICHGPSIMSIQDLGISSCTLGQLRHRADLVIYWGSNPWSAHPRHIERYTVFSEGRFQNSEWNDYVTKSSSIQSQKRLRRASDLISKTGDSTISEVSHLPLTYPKMGRKLIVVDVRRTRSTDVADYFLQVEPGKDFELLQALRLLIKYDELEVEEVAGVPVKLLEDFADILIGCDFGIIFFGLGLTMSSGKNRNIDAALSLVRDLNQRTKFLIMPMRGHFNVTGANTVSTWQTGYPYAVDFSQGYPYYNPGETSVIDILRRGESDASLIVASDPVAHFPKTAIQHLVKNPLIVVDPLETPTSLMADVFIPSAFVGIEVEGTAYRMDHVPLPLKKVVDPPKGILSDEEILDKIIQRVHVLQEGGI